MSRATDLAKPPPKGWYKSVYGGIERTKLASIPLGCCGVVSIDVDMSDDARRARIRARKRDKETDLEVQLAASLAMLEAEEARNLRGFHNGG